MEVLTAIYFAYSFLAFYFLFIFILTYFQNRKHIYQAIDPEKNLSLSIVIPCYNEEKSIGKTIESLLKSDYPYLDKIIVVDDCSTDNSFNVIKQYEQKYKKVIAVKTPKNTGCAAGAKNFGSKFVKNDLIGFSDADSFPRQDAISKMVGFFNDEKTGAVTSRVLVNNRVNKLSKIQSIEYKIIAFTRKLLGFLDSIYVTNGPLSIYRKSAFDDVSGFDESNLTEDIEITWHFVKKGWKVHMAIPAKAYTQVPTSIRAWFKQRIRWNIGGIQTINKYRKEFLKTGMLGLFILPFFTLSWILGLFGLGLLLYRFSRYLFVRYLVARYSVEANVALLALEDLSLSPSILFLFGLLLFSLGFAYTLTALYYSREKEFKNPRIHEIFLYSIFYLLAYPPLLIVSFYKYLKGYRKW